MAVRAVRIAPETLEVGMSAKRPSKGWRLREAFRGRRRRRPGLEEPTHQPDLEPAHDQPWVPKNSLTDRLRRNPRS